MNSLASSDGGVDGRSRQGPLFGAWALPAALILGALMTIVAVELVTRLQVVADGLLTMQNSAGGVALETILERALAAKNLARWLANGLALSVLIGGTGFAFFGQTSKAARYSTLAVVLLCLVRAYFWEVA